MSLFKSKEEKECERFKASENAYNLSMRYLDLYKEFFNAVQQKHPNDFFNDLVLLSGEKSDVIERFNFSYFKDLYYSNPLKYAREFFETVINPFDTYAITNFPHKFLLSVFSVLMGDLIADEIKIDDISIDFTYPNLFNEKFNPFILFIKNTSNWYRFTSLKSDEYSNFCDAVKEAASWIYDSIENKKDPRKTIPLLFENDFWKKPRRGGYEELYSEVCKLVGKK